MFKAFRTKAAKKWTSLVVTFMMALTIVAPSLSMVAKAAGEDKVFDIIEITDFHGTLVSSDVTPLPAGAVLAQNIRDVKKTNPDRTLILGGGDLYQGSPVSNVLFGVPVQKALSNLGMEVTALGNHEFDWGLDKITSTTMVGANYSIVAANLYNKNADGSKGNRAFEPYKIIEKDGIKIAIIGAITAETPGIVMPKYVDNFIFADAATEVNACAAEIKAAGTADVILALIHAGNNPSAPATGEIFDITNKLVNVNAVFGGHSHTEVHTTGANGIPIYIAKSSSKGFIDAKMTVSATKQVSFPAPSAADYIAVDTTAANGYKNASPVQDPEVKTIIDAALAEVGPTFNEVIGNVSRDITRTQTNTPYGESALGNWISDVVKNSAKADIGIQNNGGIRVDISKGDINVGQIYYLMPFDNLINVVTVNKAQLKGILEKAVVDNGKGIQISGVKFYYDPTAPAGSRVFKITRENGAAISDTESLKLAGPDFILTGGDNFTEFKDPSISSTLVNTYVLIRDAMINDVRTNKTIKYVMDTRIVKAESPLTTVSVVATSDLHGNVLNYDYATGKAPVNSAKVELPQGLAKISTYMKSLRAQNPNTMLIDNGDTIQGTPLVYYYNMIDTEKEYPMMAVMGAMGYDTWTLGNHEFNYGLTTLNRIIADAKNNGMTVLSANTYNLSGSNYVEPYYIKSFNVNGQTKKVAVLGLTTKNIPGWEDPEHYKGLEFKDLVEQANYWVPIIKAAGADVVIVSAHSGEEGTADTTEENQIKALATKVSGIDAIVAGHAHSLFNHVFTNPDGKAVYVTEPGKWGQNISQIDINFDKAGKFVDLITKTVPMTTSIAEDQEIIDLIKPYQDTTLEYIKTVLGNATKEFTGAGQYVVTTPIMDLINKVQMEAAGTQLSIAAPLSASAYIPSGEVTIQDIMGVYVYENFLFGVKMTGKQLKDWMEYSVRYYKQINDPNFIIDSTIDYKTVKDTTGLNIADYNLDMLYGATYDVDLTQPACTVDATTGRVDSGNRIKNLKYNGKLVKDTDVFTVAVNNYRFNGGGGFMKAAGLTIKDAKGVDVPNPAVVTYDSGKTLGDDGQVRSLMMTYIQNHETITPDCSNNWKLYTTAVAQEVDPVTPPTIPQTGSPIDMGVLINFGAAVSGLGVLALILEEKKRRQNNAA